MLVSSLTTFIATRFYNFLNLPQKIVLITKDNNNEINYLYSATGNKLANLTTTNHAIVTTTDYIGNFVYENNELKYILTAEGRIVPNRTGGYDYQLGRFLCTDSLADKFVWVSPYNYAENSPISNVDFWGLQKVFFQKALTNDENYQKVSNINKQTRL